MAPSDPEGADSEEGGSAQAAGFGVVSSFPSGVEPISSAGEIITPAVVLPSSAVS